MSPIIGYTRFTALTTFCVEYTSKKLFDFLLLFTLLAVACYQRWPRSSTAVNDVSIMKTLYSVER